MKYSIRSKFSTGMVFLIIILALSIFSAYYMNKLTKETGAILKENYLSVVYAREISAGLTNINQEMISGLLTGRKSDSLILKREFAVIDRLLRSEKNNITEPGEGKLVKDLETGIQEYRDSLTKYMEFPRPAFRSLNLQKKFSLLYQELSLLSQMNGKAIEVRTDDTKITSQDALIQMSILATLCFIIALFYSYSFSSYSNERFYHLYDGIREMASGNYIKRLEFDGADEFNEISSAINEMAEKINENELKSNVNLPPEIGRALPKRDMDELKIVLTRIRNIEEQAEGIIARLEDKI